MTAIAKRIVRAKAIFGDRFSNSNLIDDRNGASAEIVRGNATDFEIGVFDAAQAVADISGVASVNLRIRESQTYESTILADKTVIAANFDETLDANSWADGSKEHFVFSFTNAEMNLDPAGPKKSLWIVLTATSDSGDEITLAAGTIILHEDNNQAADPPPENPGTQITQEEAEALFVRYTESASAPASAPTIPLAVWHDTTAGVLYRAMGTATVSDWVPYQKTDGRRIAKNQTTGNYQVATLSGPAGMEAETWDDI